MRPPTNTLTDEASTTSKNRDAPDGNASGGAPSGVLFPSKILTVPSSRTNAFSGSLNNTFPAVSLICAVTSCTKPGVNSVGRLLKGITRDVSCAEAQNADKIQPTPESHTDERQGLFLVFFSMTISSL
jgi:hypothetical protein